MKLSNRQSRTILALLGLSAGLAVLFCGHLVDFIKKSDVKIVTTLRNNSDSIYEYNDVARQISEIPLTHSTETPRNFSLTKITDDPEEIFESSPPSPLDYGIIIESIYNQGYRDLVIATHVSREKLTGLATEALNSRLGKFDSVILPIAITRGAQSSELPASVRRSIIRPDQITGDDKLIPAVNRITLAPPDNPNLNNTLAGFYLIESNPSPDGKLPLIARWDKMGFIPSIHLLILMQSLDIQPSQLIIQCGKFIRLGNNGALLEIDEFGQTSAPQVTTLTAKLLASSKAAENSIVSEPVDGNKTDIALIHADASMEKETGIFGTQTLGQSLSLFESTQVLGTSKPLNRVPLWIELLILIDVAVIIYWLRAAAKTYQVAGFVLTIGIALAALATIIHFQEIWFSLGSIIASLAVGLLTPMTIRRTTTHERDYHTSDPKPVIRT